jgi:SAM-dependent methyltransferase
MGAERKTRMSDPAIEERVATYYTQKLLEHGETARGVDWKTEASQRLRFDQLLRLQIDGSASILDFGCGFGALLDYLHSQDRYPPYVGFDVSALMVERARSRHEGATGVSFTTEAGSLQPADYVIASGIFNVKLQTPEASWQAYVTETLEKIDHLARRGFAFNALSLYSDPEKRRGDLHYADPLALFDYCKRRFSPRVALLHDYPLWEFTILVRREEE